MPRNNGLSKEARSYIRDTIKERGAVTVDELVALILPHYSFDPVAAKEREVKGLSRRLMASMRDESGIRCVLAVKSQPGVFAHLDTCSNTFTIDGILEQLLDKRNGLNATIRKAQRRRAVLEGQQTMFDEAQDG